MTEAYCGHREMDVRIAYQVGLEFSQNNFQGFVKPEGSSDGGQNLPNKAVNIVWVIIIEVFMTNIVGGFIVNQEGIIRVLQGDVGGEDGRAVETSEDGQMKNSGLTFLP